MKNPPDINQKNLPVESSGIESPENIHREQDPLRYIQGICALVKIGGKIFLIESKVLRDAKRSGDISKVQYFDRRDGALIIVRELTKKFSDCKAGDIAKKFFIDPSTACFDGIEFNPSGTTDNYLNLWHGHNIIPVQGDWSMIKDFIHEILCDDNADITEYLINQLAHALQKPEVKPGIIVAMVSSPGAGKGTFMRMLQMIWKSSYLQVHDIKSVVGQFNASLELSFIVALDEAIFSGDKKTADALKSLATEETIQIEEKYQPSRQVRSCHRIFIASNHDHFFNAEHNDRRYFVLRLNDKYVGNHDYWNQLNDFMVQGGVEAMVYDLLQLDISNFNPRQKPSTPELVEQKLQSLDPIPGWWYECLSHGSIKDDDKWPDFIATKDALEAIKEFAGRKLYSMPHARQYNRIMRELCPSTESVQKTYHSNKTRGLTLPSLSVARTEFEAYIGGSVVWEDPADFPDDDEKR